MAADFKFTGSTLIGTVWLCNFLGLGLVPLEWPIARAKTEGSLVRIELRLNTRDAQTLCQCP
jgi:hypothetical protein